MKTEETFVNKIVANVEDSVLKEKIESLLLSGCLKKPLEFGNEEQIKALKDLQKRADLICEIKEIEDTGKEYEVEIHFSGTYTTSVIARNEEEARDIAERNFDLTDTDDFIIDDFIVDDVEVL